MTSQNDIILEDGKPANGEKFYIWPDPTGRLGDSRLWPHFIDFLCNNGTYPLDWERGVESLSESQLLRAFSSVRRLFFQPVNVDGQWAVALEFVRTRLQTINPNASIAFCLHPHDDRAALTLLKRLNLGEEHHDPTSLALPSLDDSITEME